MEPARSRSRGGKGPERRLNKALAAAGAIGHFRLNRGVRRPTPDCRLQQVLASATNPVESAHRYRAARIGTR